MPKDLTVIYLTANKLSDHFGNTVRALLKQAIGDLPLISMSKKPMDFGYNIALDTPSTHVNIYREALIGVKEAKTKYIAIVEDDTLYSPDHFKYRPSSPDVFAYNIATWSLYTWNTPPIFTYKGRRNHNVLICERALYIDAMDERFARWPDASKIELRNWAEPGKYEEYLGVSLRKTEKFMTHPANIMFSHEKGLSFAGLGTRKRMDKIRALEIPYWGRAEQIMKIHHE
jgi:hypothetical protein